MKYRHLLLSLVLAGFLPVFSASAAAPSVTAGKVVAVHDGDTFTLAEGQKIRVFGIDAPELRQLCRADAVHSAGSPSCVPCGDASRKVLEGLILGQVVSCKSRGQSYDRVVGECAVGEIQIGPWMLSHGYAVAYEQFLRKKDRGAYLGAAASAKRAGTGIWAMTFIPPANWRNHKQRLQCER